MSMGLQELANDLVETAGELMKSISGGDYGRALRCRRRLDKTNGQAVQLLSLNQPPSPAMLAYRAALAKANGLLAGARIKARVERDRIGRAMRHCGSVKSWIEVNRSTF